MQSKIMLAKEVYDKSEKQVLQLEREWYAGRYLSKVEDYYDLNVMAALIYLLKNYNGSFVDLDAYFSSNKINNHDFQNTMKKYIFKSHVQEFLQKNLNIDDLLLIGIALFYNEYKMSRTNNSIESNESLNQTMEYLLKIEDLNSFSLMQVGLSDGTILLDMVKNYNLKRYYAYNRDRQLMVTLQLRVLLLEMFDSQLMEADILNGAFAVRNQLIVFYVYLFGIIGSIRR